MSSEPLARRPGAAFYTLSSEAYFLGAVAMINSLRLQGHSEPIYLLDLGLGEHQRELLAPEVSFVEAPPRTPPWLSKTIAPLRHPAEVMVLIDADMIATRPLGELIETAREGKVVAFENDTDRWVPEWGELLGLGELERRPYLCSGFVAIGADPGREVLELIDDRQRRVEFERTFFARNEPDYALLYLDQDVLNAVLAGRVDRGRVVGLEHRLGPSLPVNDPELVDPRTLRCSHADGIEPFVIHHLLPAKPWLKPMYDGTYSRLLKRLLVGPDLAIRVPTSAVPLRLREGALARLERTRVDASVRVRFNVGIRLDRYRHRLGRQPRDPMPRA